MATLSQKRQEQINKFKASLNSQTKTPIHPSFKPGDEVTGVYERDETQRTVYGPQDIIVISTEDNSEIGVWRNVYINNAIEIADARPGYLVQITCTGTGISPSGYDYPKLEVVFADPETLDD